MKETVKVDGAYGYYQTIRNAFNRKLGGLVKTKLGYVNHGGDAECYRWDNVLFVLASHARGKTFFIYLVDERGGLFEVYGVTGGNRGWTETYGWTHKGTWVKPILAYLRQLERAIIAKRDEDVEAARKKQADDNRGIGERVAKFNDMFREVNANDTR